LAVGIFEVDTAAAVVVVDLSRVRARRIRPVLEPALADASEDAIELVLADQKRVVLDGDVAVRVAEIERHAVVELDDEEMAGALRRRAAEDLGQERRRAPLVATPDDRVVERDAHALPPATAR